MRTTIHYLFAGLLVLRRHAFQFHDARLEPLELLRELSLGLSLGLSHEAVPGNGYCRHLFPPPGGAGTKRKVGDCSTKRRG